MPKIKSIALLFLCVLLGSLLLNSCGRWQRWNTATTDAGLVQRFADRPLQPNIKHYRVGERSIRYLDIGSDTLPVTLLIHGAPSSLTSWMRYLQDEEITRHTRLIAVDRPGYGGSDFGQPEVSVARQSELLRPLLDSLAAAPSLQIVGSSYGGTLSVRLGMDYPDRIDRLVLVSASMAPGSEKIYEVSFLIELPGMGGVVPKMVYVANEEKLHHFDQLQAMQTLWSRIEAPVTILHGTRDNLIYYDNAEYALEQLTRSDSVQLVTVPKADHGLPWSHPELVKAAILAPWVPVNLDTLLK